MLRVVCVGETGLIMMYGCQWLSRQYLLKCNRWILSGKLILIESLLGWKIFLIWSPYVPISLMSAAPTLVTQIWTQSTSSLNGSCLNIQSEHFPIFPQTSFYGWEKRFEKFFYHLISLLVIAVHSLKTILSRFYSGSKPEVSCGVNSLTV